MLINLLCVAAAPSRRVAEPSLRFAAVGSDRPAEFGPGAFVRGRAGLAADVSWMPGVGSGGSAAAGYLPALPGSFRLGQLAAGPVQATKGQATKGQADVTTKNAVDNSTDQHNSIQAIRLVPAGRGEVGPHPVREPGPA